MLQIGANVTVMPGVTIGERAVIGGGSVVTHDVPADTVAVGNPARVIRRIDQSEILSDETIKQLEDNVRNEKSTASNKIISQMTLDQQLAARLDQNDKK